MSRHHREGDAGNQKLQEQLKSLDRDRRDLQKADLRELMSAPVGRRFVWRMLDEFGGLHGASYSNSGSDTFYREGKRAVAIELMLEVQRVAPADYVRMVEEALGARADEVLARKAAKAAVEREE